MVIQFKALHCYVRVLILALQLLQNLIENGLGSQVIVFRLLYCLFLPRTSEGRLTSFLSWLPVLYIVNAKAIRVPAQIGQASVVPLA